MCYIMGWIVKKTKCHTFHRIRRSTTLKWCSLHFNLLTRIFINPRTVILMRTNTAYSDAVTWENERLFAIICYILWTMCKAVCIWTACTDWATSPNMCCSLRVCADIHPRWPATCVWEDPARVLVNASACGMIASASGPTEAQVCVSDVPENGRNIWGF